MEPKSSYKKKIYDSLGNVELILLRRDKINLNSDFVSFILSTWNSSGDNSNKVQPFISQAWNLRLGVPAAVKQ